MDAEAIKELKRRAAAATPGPWYQIGAPWSDGSHVNTQSDPHGSQVICGYDSFWDADGEDETDWHSNMAYIAAANPATLLSLIAHAEHHATALRRIREIVAIALLAEASFVPLGAIDVLAAGALGEDV